MTLQIPAQSLTQLAIRSSRSSSRPAQRTLQIIQQQLNHCTPIIRQSNYHPARRRTFTTTAQHAKQKQIDTETITPRRPRVYLAKDAVEKEFVLDEDIPTRDVQLKDAETGKLRPPQSLVSILSTIDRDVMVVRCLVAPPNAPAVVEVIPHSDLVDRLKNKEIHAMEHARSTRVKRPKQIEVNWALSSNDLQLKLKQLRDFLEKGKRVDILLASRKRQRKATLEEAQNVVSEIRRTIEEIEGCKEIAPMDGKIGGQALMIVQKVA